MTCSARDAMRALVQPITRGFLGRRRCRWLPPPAHGAGWQRSRSRGSSLRAVSDGPSVAVLEPAGPPAPSANLRRGDTLREKDTTWENMISTTVCGGRRRSPSLAQSFDDYDTTFSQGPVDGRTRPPPEGNMAAREAPRRTCSSSEEAVGSRLRRRQPDEAGFGFPRLPYPGEGAGTNDASTTGAAAVQARAGTAPRPSPNSAAHARRSAVEAVPMGPHRGRACRRPADFYRYHGGGQVLMVPAEKARSRRTQVVTPATGGRSLDRRSPWRAEDPGPTPWAAWRQPAIAIA